MISRLSAALVAALLLAAALPLCPAPAAPASAEPAVLPLSHAARAAEPASERGAHEDCARPARSWRAPCTCGCADTPGADASPFRVPPGLLAAGPAHVVIRALAAPPVPDETLPSFPREPVEHVPLRPSA